MKRFHLWKNFLFAYNGLSYYLRNEKSAWILLPSFLIISIAGFYFEIALIEWLALIICFTMVLALELVNTAIEKTVDKISPEWNELAGRIKDISAGAVLVAVFGTAVVTFVIFAIKISNGNY